MGQCCRNVTSRVLACKDDGEADDELVRACKEGDERAVARLVDVEGKNPDGTGGASTTPLAAAVLSTRSNRANVVRMLLERGASVNGRRRRGTDALYAACHRPGYLVNQEIAILLIRWRRRQILPT